MSYQQGVVRFVDTVHTFDRQLPPGGPPQGAYPVVAPVAVAPLGLLVVDPHLPAWLRDLALEGLRVGDAPLDLAFQRDSSGCTTWRVLHRDGWVRVVRQPPPQAARSGVLGRALAALGSIARS